MFYKVLSQCTSPYLIEVSNAIICEIDGYMKDATCGVVVKPILTWASTQTKSKVPAMYTLSLSKTYYLIN